MSKTIRKQPKWIATEEERLKRKNACYQSQSRKVAKQQLERELEEALSNVY